MSIITKEETFMPCVVSPDYQVFFWPKHYNKSLKEITGNLSCGKNDDNDDNLSIIKYNDNVLEVDPIFRSPEHLYDHTQQISALFKHIYKNRYGVEADIKDIKFGNDPELVSTLS